MQRNDGYPPAGSGTTNERREIDTMDRTRWKLLAAALAGMLLLAGCDVDAGDDPNRSPAGPTDTPSPTIAPGAETPAAELRAAIGAGIQSHVYLLGVATATLIREGSGSPGFVQTQATIDDNTAALAEIVASAFGEEAAGRFTDLWTAQVGYVNDYARGYAEGDEALRTQMAQELDTFRVDIGTLFDELTDGVVPAETGTAQIEPMFDGELEVVDAQVAGGDVTRELRETVGDAPPLADLLAGAIIVHEPDRYRDSVEAPSSILRSTMQALWQEHTFLTWYAVDAGLRSGFGSSAFASARASLDANTAEMAERWGEDYGADSARAFEQAWQSEVDAMLAYAQGSGTALDDLEVFQASLAQIVQEETRLLIDQEAFEAELVAHTETTTEAIDARRNDTRLQWDELLGAASQMPVLADIVATATIQRFPDVYGPEG
jgi:hypothetical protein